MPSISRTVKPKNEYREQSEQWERMKGAFVDSTHLSLMRDHAMQPWYAYIKPSAPGSWCELLALPDGAEVPSGFELIAAERIPSGTKGMIRTWFERFAGRLPVFPQ